MSNWLWALRTGSQNKLCRSVIVPLWNMSSGINRVEKAQQLTRTACLIQWPTYSYSWIVLSPFSICFGILMLSLPMLSAGLDLPFQPPTPPICLLIHSRKPNKLTGKAPALWAICQISFSPSFSQQLNILFCAFTIFLQLCPLMPLWQSAIQAELNPFPS